MTTDLVRASELDALRGRLEGELSAYLADLERLCSIDCGSYTPGGVNQVADWVAAFLERLGASVQRRRDPAGRYGDTVIATIPGLPGAGPRVLLIGHTDTVFGEGTLDLRNTRPEGKTVTVDANCVFGALEILIPKGVPLSVRANAAFADLNLPGGRSANFGESTYESPGLDPAKPHLGIRLNAVFSRVSFSEG